MCPVFLPDNSWLRFRVCWPFPCVLVFCLFRRSPFCAPVVKPLSAGCAFLFGWERLRGIRDINVLFAFPPGFMAFRPVGASFRFGMSVRPSVSVPSFPQSARSPCFQPTVGIPLFSCFACLHLNIYEDVSFRAPLFVPPAPIGLSCPFFLHAVFAASSSFISLFSVPCPPFLFYLPPSILKKKFSLSVFGVSCCKTRVLQRVSCPYGCVCVSLCRGCPGKKLAKRLAVTLKGCTFALAFGKQGRQGRCGSGAVNERVH